MDQFGNLPAPMQWVLGTTGLGAVLAVGWFGLHGQVLLFALILVVLLVVLVGCYWLIGSWRRRRQNARLGGELGQSITAAPPGMSAAEIAKLDSLRKKFQEGIDAFRSRGKDLYTLPWYAIIGESGSGKTEA